ncbi:unnamed protein product [Clonostachys rhizophaga]|uniref:Carboxylesterase type B domain-containing protein n=1 Tax=Clonostachys rhizophaga TaxID=160324 RepID=A0A9N9V2Y4_9HYPO|nr:unnamed protein product [Clonostachys rhizophaga]
MRSKFCTALVWLAHLATAQFSLNPTTKTSIAQTSYGTIITNNITETGISVFKGIPYAKPPVGDLRWRSPLPPDAWAQPINATVGTTSCWGFVGGNVTETTSEDCLYLNVWTPAKTETERLPVMVWVHGGGFNFDSGLNPLFEGVHMCLKGVVVVTINYRLGNFGYLAHPALDAEDPVGNSGNFGLQDIMQAFRWVRGNIEAFGGDPKNVMAFGESAGAHALPILMASPLSEGLFDKVTCSSGTYWDSEHGNMESFAQSRQRGLNWADSAARPNATLPELRGMPAYLVQITSLWNGLDPATVAFSPNIDNYIIPKYVPSVFSSGEQARVPLVAGFNAREDTLFQQRALEHGTADLFNERLFSWLSMSGLPEATIRDAMNKYYPAISDTQAEDPAFLWTGDMVIRQQTWEAVHEHERTTGQPSWLYTFNFTSEFNPIPGHGQDMPYDFGTLRDFGLSTPGVKPGPDDAKMAMYIMTYLTNFAKSSDPNKPDNLRGTLPHWPSYSACEGTSECPRNTCGPHQGRIFELANPTSMQEFDYSRLQFIQSLRKDGVLPTGWHDFVVNSLSGLS